MLVENRAAAAHGESMAQELEAQGLHDSAAQVRQAFYVIGDAQGLPMEP